MRQIPRPDWAFKGVSWVSSSVKVIPGLQHRPLWALLFSPCLLPMISYGELINACFRQKTVCCACLHHRSARVMPQDANGTSNEGYGRTASLTITACFCADVPDTAVPSGSTRWDCSVFALSYAIVSGAFGD
jgi:hypothetical protein